jgi:hypothetical protein
VKDINKVSKLIGKNYITWLFFDVLVIFLDIDLEFIFQEGNKLAE